LRHWWRHRARRWSPSSIVDETVWPAIRSSRRTESVLRSRRRRFSLTLLSCERIQGSSESELYESRDESCVDCRTRRERRKSQEMVESLEKERDSETVSRKSGS
jgi:hypothetical protein